MCSFGAVELLLRLRQSRVLGSCPTGVGLPTLGWQQWFSCRMSSVSGELHGQGLAAVEVEATVLIWKLAQTSFSDTQGQS